MKTLCLLRHAEAASHDGADRDRLLTEQGREQARRLGDALRECGKLPDFVLCSPARRTLETLEGLALQGASVDFQDKIYNAAVGDLFALLQGVGDGCEAVLMVGHNPAIHGLANFLSGAGDTALRGKIVASYLPSTLSVFEGDFAHWRDLQPQSLKLVDVLSGREGDF